MKTAMFVNMAIMTIYAVCVTYAAVYFNNPKILWWYVLMTLIGFSYKSGGTEDGK